MLLGRLRGLVLLLATVLSFAALFHQMSGARYQRTFTLASGSALLVSVWSSGGIHLAAPGSCGQRICCAVREW